ncbi:MAG: sialate O-acetylesterase family protein [Planctomycetota bacterium]|jgi:sialate O-acetylesterase
MRSRVGTVAAAIALATAIPGTAAAGTLKLHGIFSSNMVIQRGKPIMIWGWAATGAKVSAHFGEEKAEAAADEEAGRWEVTFPSREADASGRKLTVVSGGETIVMDNIVIGDVWVMNGQSNMAFALGKTSEADLEGVQAHVPLFREVRINPNERETLQTDIPARALPNGGWVVAGPETAGGFSSIGYSFGVRLQRALQVPIGIIDNARGGASIESLVPLHKFDDHPVAAAYKAHLDERIAEFDPAAVVERKWQNQTARLKRKGVPEEKWPPKPGVDSLRSWDVPGRSPSDAGSCYNGMFAVFRGLSIKGVLFHQGYNNAIATVCRPKRYRVLMKLMVEGWREDFDDPTLPVGVIGFCAGSIPQTRENFEAWSVSTGAYIREAQRLGLADLEDPTNTAFLPGYDVQIPGLHPSKKLPHAVRAARWALGRIYGVKVNWDSASLVSAEQNGDHMVLTFDKKVMPDDMSMVPEGFSIADKSGRFYMAHAAFPLAKDVGIWNTANKSCDATKIHVWSPLVEEPVAVRYAWAASPMGNLKVNGKEWLPLHSFRTDAWDWPEDEDPSVSAVDRAKSKAMKSEAAERCDFRRMEEARLAIEVLERLKTLGRKRPGSGRQ